MYSRRQAQFMQIGEYFCQKAVIAKRLSAGKIIDYCWLKMHFLRQ